MTSFRLAFCFVLVACSSTDDPTDPDWVPSDIDTDQRINQLGTLGYAKLCSAFDDYVHDKYRSSYLIKAACTAHALETTADAAACGVALDECLGTLPPVVDQQLDQILAQASCAEVAINPNTCSSPVSAIKACLDALGVRVDQIQLSVACAAFGAPVPEMWWMIQEPSECVALRSGCGG